jgi:hypothetical protein
MLPVPPKRYLQKGDLNPTWEWITDEAIIGRAGGIVVDNQTIPLWGWRFRIWNTLLWILLGLRDLLRLIARKVGRPGGLGEGLLSRKIAVIIGLIRKQEDSGD